MALEEQKVSELDRYFGVKKARLFFMFSYSKTDVLLGLTL